MSRSRRDPWRTLGVERDATDAQIKRAYHKKALEYHPDRNQDDADAKGKFQDVARAYEEIATAEKRASWIRENEQGIYSDFETVSEQGDFPPFAAAVATPNRSGKITAETTIEFSEAFSGTDREIELMVEELCDLCAGSGSAPGHQPRQCVTCGGSGKHKVGRLESACASCEGNGYFIDKPCGRCDRGLVRKPHKLTLRVPSGVSDGHILRIRDDRRFDGAEVLVSVRVKPSPVFKRELDDPAHLVIDVPISVSEAVLGAVVSIPTPEKVIKLKVPEGSASNKMLRISGQGMPVLGKDERGNLYARLVIQIPTNPTREQRKLFKELASKDPADLRYHLFNPYAAGGEE